MEESGIEVGAGVTGRQPQQMKQTCVAWLRTDYGSCTESLGFSVLASLFYTEEYHICSTPGCYRKKIAW